MSKRRVQVVILCEDKQQRTFAERLLKGLSYKDKLRPLPLPAGRGAGEQYVREHYAADCPASLQGAVLELRRLTKSA